jgi:hypothetical protein
VTELTLELFLATFIPFLGLALGLVYKVLSDVSKVSGDVRLMRGSLETLIGLFGALGQTPPAGLPDTLKSEEPGGGNPYDPRRKNELLEVWKEGLLSPEQVQELVAYLQEDARNATGAVLAAILIAIALLGALIVALSVK